MRLENSAKVLERGKAALKRAFLKRQKGIMQKLAGTPDTRGGQILRGRHAMGRFKEASEINVAHIAHFCKVSDGQIGVVKMRIHILMRGRELVFAVACNVSRVRECRNRCINAI